MLLQLKMDLLERGGGAENNARMQLYTSVQKKTQYNVARVANTHMSDYHSLRGSSIYVSEVGAPRSSAPVGFFHGSRLRRWESARVGVFQRAKSQTRAISSGWETV